MLDALYENIGGKIKGLAKGIFSFEAIAAIIAGIVTMFNGGLFLLYGLLMIVVGPIIAWISSWVLYAFGELVEKTCDNEYKTSQMMHEILVSTSKKQNTKREYLVAQQSETKVETVETTTEAKEHSAHRWRCDRCGNMRTQTPCEHCGN